MIYSVIDTKKGISAGLNTLAHVLLKGGSKMIVNENELRKVNQDIEQAAASLGGELMTHSELEIYKRKNK